MSKTETTYDEAVEMKNAAKAELAEAKQQLKDFMKENEIKKGETPEDEKLAKKLGKLETAVETKRAFVEEVSAMVKELKPKVARALKYEYPEEIIGDAKEMKKFRARMRTAAKAEADGDAKPEKVKKEKAPREEKEEKAPRAEKEKKRRDTAED